MSYTFQIQFISPLLIGGSDPRGLDEVGLRGSSLRGCWRFWARALLGGMLANLNDYSRLLELENQLFGATDQARFRLKVLPVGHPVRNEFARLPHQTGGRMARRPGYAEGAQFQVEVRSRPNLEQKQQKALLAAIWLWGNLGAIGNRSRRGFGSPVLIASGVNNPFAVLDLPLMQEFPDTNALSKHLQQGVQRAWEIFESWLRAIGETVNSLRSLNDPGFTVRDFEFFTLRNLQQISVSIRTFTDLGCVMSAPSATGAIAAIHGDRAARPELGQASPRLASPAFLRLHKVGSQWVPVCTWSRFRRIRDRGRARAYLTSIGFTHSILGTPW